MQRPSIIEYIERLKQLLRAAVLADTLEDFTQALEGKPKLIT